MDFLNPSKMLPCAAVQMKDSTEIDTSPKSKSRNSNSLVQIQIQPKIQIQVVPRDAEKSESLDLVDFGEVALKWKFL